MSNSKTYAVVLTDHGAKELGILITAWIKKNEMGSYINAKAVDPNGPFFLMRLERLDPDGQTREMELQIPHIFIKAIFNAADMKSIGFI
ncbi:MAG: hypothetical protein RL571_2823 [Pseudomonadota bacterium]